MNKLLLLSVVALSLGGCETFFRAQDRYCGDAALAVDLICNVSPTIPVGAAGGEVTDPTRANCVFLQDADKVPLEYCRE